LNRADIKVAAAAGLSVYLPLYWQFTRADSDGTPNPLTAGEAGVLLLVLAAYLSAPAFLRLLSRLASHLHIAGSSPSWLSISALGAAVLVSADYVFGASGLSETVDDAARTWLVLSAWAMPPSAAVYYFGAVVRLIKGWHRGPDYFELSLRK
jgi:hypothetical protein